VTTALTEELQELEEAIFHARSSGRASSVKSLPVWEAEATAIRQRIQEEQLETWGPGPHGRLSTFARGCRCPECRAAKRERARAILQDKRERRIEMDGRMVYPSAPHGTISGYTRYACRCEDCSNARREYMDTWRANRKKEIH
jgi:hypothetical protein